MKLEKKYELQGKRLDKALEKVKELQSELDIQKSDNEKVTVLINELETLKKEWLDKIDEKQKEIDAVRKKHTELDIMIKQLRILRKKIK